MRETTRALIEIIKKMPFFGSIGTSVGKDATRVHLWKEALVANRGKQWDWMLMEARNTFTRCLHRESPERFQRWNDLTAEIKPELEPIVQRLAGDVQPTGADRVHFEATLAWSLLAICMEKEFEGVCTTDFYDRIWSWYQRGHFPCGWDGILDSSGEYKKTYESGKLIVF